MIEGKDDNEIPSFLKLNIVQSHYGNICTVINSFSLIYFFSMQILYGGRLSSMARVIGIPNETSKFLYILFILSLSGPFVAYYLEKKYKLIGSISISCKEKELIYNSNDNIQSIKMDEISRIILDLSSVKGEMSFGSMYSSGTKNYLTLVWEQKKETFEVLLNSKDELNQLKMIIFYHTVKFR